MIWEKLSQWKWRAENGFVILKYRMAGEYSFLLYDKNEDIEGGDYSVHFSLTEAKDVAEARA